MSSVSLYEILFVVMLLFSQFYFMFYQMSAIVSITERSVQLSVNINYVSIVNCNACVSLSYSPAFVPNNIVYRLPAACIEKDLPQPCVVGAKEQFRVEGGGSDWPRKFALRGISFSKDTALVAKCQWFYHSSPAWPWSLSTSSLRNSVPSQSPINTAVVYNRTGLARFYVGIWLSDSRLLQVGQHSCVFNCPVAFGWVPTSCFLPTAGTLVRCGCYSRPRAVGCQPPQLLACPLEVARERVMRLVPESFSISMTTMVHYLPPVISTQWRRRSLSARERLLLLLRCYRCCRHQRFAQRLYQAELHQLGVAFSSNSAGDGPPKRTAIPQKIGDRSLVIGTRVYVPWSSFAEASHTLWHAFCRFQVIGVYTKLEKTRAYVTFAAIDQGYWLDSNWITVFGSATYTHNPVLTRELYAQVTQEIARATTPSEEAPASLPVLTAHTSAETLPPHLPMETPTHAAGLPEVAPLLSVPPFQPAANVCVYVPWSSFGESSGAEWRERDINTIFVAGIYIAALKNRWWIHFPALTLNNKARKHLQNRQWIASYGSTCSLPIGGSELTAHAYQQMHQQHLPANNVEEDEGSTPVLLTKRSLPIEIPVSPTEGFPPVPPTCGKGIGIGLLNINAVCTAKLGVAHWLASFGISITVLVDTRTSLTAQRFLVNDWRQLAGKEAQIQFSTQHDNVSVGGQAHLLSGFWGRHFQRSWSDPSNLGVVFETTYRIGTDTLRIISVYRPHPCSTPENNGLSAKLQHWLDINRNRQSCDEYLQAQLMARRHKSARYTIVLGDFNLPAPALGAWASLKELKSSLAAVKFYSRYSGFTGTSCIDHIFHNLPQATGGYSVDERWSSYSDHRPIWVHAPIPMTPHCIIRKTTRPISLALRTEVGLAKYQAKWARYSASVEPRNCIAEISSLSYEYAMEHRPYPTLHFWTPVTGGLFLWARSLQDCLDHGFSCLYLERARRKILAMVPDGPAVWDELSAIPMLGTLTPSFPPPSRATLKAYLVTTQKLLTGRKRKERFLKIQARLKALRESKHLFYHNLRPPRVPIDLSQLEVDGTTHTDPATIDRLISEDFGRQFQGYPAPRGLWDSCRHFADFRNILPTPVPEDVARRLHQALYNVPEDKRACVASNLVGDRLTPTWQDFQFTLRAASKESAGGHSGCTYLMLQSLPDPIQRQLYDALLACWTSNLQPDLWRLKMVYPLGKKLKVYTIKNIRPIVLLEVTRKLWFKIITKKISAALENARILQDNQAGFRGQRSCSDNLLQLINALEASEDQGIYISSWDIKGAFNAPPRQWLELGLERLGVPSHLAAMLAYLDDGDINTLLSPYHNATQKGQPFETWRGVGQGDVISPLLWNAFFDIILTGMNSIPSGIFSPLPTGQIFWTQDTAYADDLLSFGSSLDILQAKATLMSAFAATMDFHLAVEKFRCFTTSTPGNLCLFDNLWRVTSVVCNAEGFFKYLGSTRDVDGTSTEEAQVIADSITSIFRRIAGKVHKADHGTTYINTAITPAITYKAVHGTALADLSSYRRLSVEYKRYAHLPMSFPTAILCAPLSMGGMGLQHPSHIVPDLKWRLLQRSLTSPSPSTQHSAAAILFRNAHLANSTFQQASHSLGHLEGRWISEVTKLCLQLGITIKMAHSGITNDLDSALPLTSDLTDLGLRHYSDVVEIYNDKLRTIRPTALGLPADSWSHRVFELRPVIIRPHHFWTASFSEEPPANIYEFLGFEGSVPIFRRWCVESISKLTRSRIGSLSRHRYVCQEITSVTSSLTHKCVVRCEGQYGFIHHTSPLPWIFRQYDQSTTYFDSATFCASDGSYSEASTLFPTVQTATSVSAFVVPSANTMARVQLSGSKKRAFDAELFALALAASSTQGRLYTDCKSLVVLAQRTRFDPNPLVAILRNNKHRIDWIESHPEKKKKPQDWTPLDAAIFAADRLAGNATAATTTPADHQQLLLKAHGGWALTHQKGLVTLPLAHLIAEQELTIYLSSRTTAAGQIWTQSALEYLTSSVVTTIASRASLVKLFLGRFDADLQVLQQRRIPCTCSCDNSFETWMTTCQRVDCIQHRHSLVDKLDQLALPTKLRQAVDGILTARYKERFLRGNWDEFIREIFTSAFDNQVTQNRLLLLKFWRKHLKLLIACVTNFSLTMYNLISHPKDSPRAKAPTSYQTSITRFFPRVAGSSDPAPKRQKTPQSGLAPTHQSPAPDEWVQKYPS